MAPRVTVLFLAGTLLVNGANAQSTGTPNSGSAPGTTTSLPPGITLAPTHAPFPTPNNPALPSEFSDIPARVVSCWDAQANYSTTSSFLSREIQSALQSSESLYPSGYVSLSRYILRNYLCTTTALPTLTTLCDGWPRASSLTVNCQDVEETYTWSPQATYYWFTPSWSTELEQLPSPTCKPASDFGPVCSRLKDAYSWRVSNLQAQPSATGSIASPGCSVLLPTPSGAAPRCHLEGGTWEAFYWPTPTPTGAALCGSSITNVTVTPAPSARATAVVSGLTMTSPSIYHLVRNATLQTFFGRASNIGEPESFGVDQFAPSTSAPLLTVKQLEADILTMTRGCAGSGRGRYCTWRGSSGFFLIADLATARAVEYCRPYDCWEDETIYQAEYTPTIALGMTDVAAQNSVFKECEWTTPGARVRTAGPAAWRGPTMKQSDWHTIAAIATGAQETVRP